MAQSQNTVREILVASALASETTLPTFVASASTGEVAVVAADGSAVGFGKPFVVVLKTADGIIKSDVVDPSKVFSYKAVPYVARVLRVITLSSIQVPATAGLKAEYIVDIRLYNHGSLSVENFKIFHGHYVLTQTSGPLNAETVVDGLISNLNKNFSKEPGATASTNPLFTFSRGSSGAGSTLIITAKDQTLQLGKDEGRPLEFDVMLKIKTPETEAQLTHVNTVTAAGNPGTGTGRQVALMEYFYRGNRGDIYRGVGFPYTWPLTTKTLADPAVAYDLVEVKHYVAGDGLNALIMPKELTIASLESADIATGLAATIDTFVAPSLASLGNVNATAPANGEQLTYNSSTGQWGPGAA
jgi:hypothetical protein